MKFLFSVTALSALMAVFACTFSGCNSSGPATNKTAQNQMGSGGDKMEPGMSPLMNDNMAPKMGAKMEPNMAPKMNPAAESK